MNQEQLQLFEEQTIRTAWDEEKEEWYFSIVDVVGVLTDSVDYDAARNYWKVMKHRMIKEGNELVTNCNQLKLKAADGKRRIFQESQIHKILMKIKILRREVAVLLQLQE